jgi:methylenetetrahydrofolate reductase (NADPH)
MDTSTIADLLRRGDRPTFSFEYFPPADPAGAYQLLDTVVNLAGLNPDWVSVTYGATGATRQRTFDALAAIRRHGGVRTMGHLTIAGQSRREVEEALATYEGLGVSHILAIRGDMPGGPAVPFEPHPEGLTNATELVRLVRASGHFTVGVAAFADSHPSRLDPDLDVRILLDKEEAGASFAVTQMVFRASSYVRLVDRFRAGGGTIPIIAGIMPITNLGQIERFRALAGDVIPADLVALLSTAADDPRRVRELAVGLVTQLCDDLLACGAPGLQFFTLNRSTTTSQIVARLRTIPPHRASRDVAWAW